ncbi:MAG: dihydrodipicolinate synthase family protein [Terriglobia bacterium]
MRPWLTGPASIQTKRNHRSFRAMDTHPPGNLAGVFAALPTPFASTGEPAWEALDTVVDFALNRGLKGLCLGGATSEYAACSVENRVEVFDRVSRRVKGRAHLVCAVGAEHAGQVKQMAAAAAHSGAIALLLPPPVFLPYSQADLVDFMAQVSAELPLPVLLYHIPQCTRDLGIANILQLIATVPNIIGLKDSSGDRGNLKAIGQAHAETSLAFLIGSDDLLLEAFEYGAAGAISGIASACPELILPLFEALRAGNSQKAHALQTQVDEFIRHAHDLPSPWTVKLALQVRGLDGGVLAWPLSPALSEKARAFQDWLTGQIVGDAFGPRQSGS